MMGKVIKGTSACECLMLFYRDLLQWETMLPKQVLPQVSMPTLLAGLNLQFFKPVLWTGMISAGMAQLHVISWCRY